MSPAAAQLIELLAREIATELLYVTAEGTSSRRIADETDHSQRRRRENPSDGHGNPTHTSKAAQT